MLSAQEKAYRFLKKAIINLEFEPNQKLRAQDVATRLEVSRTPVREAFGRLEQEGLIKREGGWGYVVGGLTFKEALDVYRVREALEVEAVREVIPKMTPELIVWLESCLNRADACLRSGQVSEYRENTRAFYRTLVKGTDNNILDYMYSVIDARIQWLGAIITNRYGHRSRESSKDNKNLLEALKNKDQSAAEAAVRIHVSGAREIFLTRVVSMPDENL